MKSRIEELLEKYWEGASSLAEEKELRKLLFTASGYEKEKGFFAALGQFKTLEPRNLRIPKRNSHRLIPPGIRWAASITLLLGTYWGWTTFEQKQAEKAAYQEVMDALSLIQTNLSKGQQQLQPLNDLKYLNTTNQLFQLHPTQ